MKLNTTNSFELPPEGLVVARCCRIVDLGTQTGHYLGKTTVQRKIMVGFELLGSVARADGKKFQINKIYTASLHPKATLRKDLDSWNGRALSNEEVSGFSFAWMAGRLCEVRVTHSDTSGENKATIDQVRPSCASRISVETDTPVEVFDLDAPSKEVFFSLSGGIRRMVELSPEWRASPLCNQPAANDINLIRSAQI